MNLDEAREAFLSFFEKNEHERIDRASVVARWRNDIYLSIASIAVFNLTLQVVLQNLLQIR